MSKRSQNQIKFIENRYTNIANEINKIGDVKLSMSFNKIWNDEINAALANNCFDSATELASYMEDRIRHIKNKLNLTDI